MILMDREDRCIGWFWRVSESGDIPLISSYSGAPFFSSMGALRFGADLAHVICEPTAGAVIKT